MFTWAKISIYKVIFAIILLKSYTNAAVEFVKAPSTTIEAFPGESVTIDCVISGLTDDHVVEWMTGKDKDIISQNHNILEDFKHSFTISQQSIAVSQQSISQQSYDFSLSLKTAADNYELDFFLSVRYKNEVTVLNSLSTLSVAWTIPEPKCAKLYESTSVSEGETMRMMCQSSQGHELDVYYAWSKNGDIVSPGRPVYNLYTFYISKSDHNAEFICNATKLSTGEIRSCSVNTLTVNYAPTVFVRHTSILEYECEVDARPSATPMWSSDPMIPLSSFNVKDNATFFITVPDAIPTGVTLMCTASNTEGIGSDIIKITKNEPTTIVPTYEEDARKTVPYKNKSRDDNNNMIMILSLVVGGVVFIVIIGLYTFGCCKKSKGRKSDTATVSFITRDIISDEAYQSNQLELGTRVQRNKKDSPYEVIETNEACPSMKNGIPIVADSGRNDRKRSVPDGNSPRKSHGYANIVLKVGDTMEDGMSVTAMTNSNVRSTPAIAKSARNTVYAVTQEHITTRLDTKPNSQITYASVVPKSKRAGKENMTKSIHSDFSFSQASAEETKTSATKAKQDPRLSYAIVIPKSKRNTNMNVIRDNCNDNNKIDEHQELSTNKRQNMRFGYTNVIRASEGIVNEKKHETASCDFLINDNLSTPNKRENDHDKMNENNKVTTRNGYTLVIPKSKRTTNGDRVKNSAINKSTDFRISYVDIDFSNIRQDGKPQKASKDSRVSYADIDFSHGNTRQNRKSCAIPKSQRNHDGMNNP